jgi:hypothetical protein
MQNSRCQLKKYWSIFCILTLTPFLLWATIPIFPTFDDWTSLTSPSFEELFTKEHWLFFGYHWRPFDSLFGYLLGLNPQLLFPTLNHCCVVVGHVLCSLLVFRILTTLQFNNTAVNISTLFFFITPAAMATVLAVDSMNQTYALFWGLLSFLLYIQLKKLKYAVWIILIFIATLCKENGLMWALIGPLLAFGFNIIDQRTLKKDIIVAVSVIVGYALAILLLPKDIIIHPEYEPGIMKTMGNVVKFVFTTFIHTDYIYLLHQPHRNLLLAGILFLLAVPFFYHVFVAPFRMYVSKKMICTVLCLLIAVGPHLVTCYSMMHTYAGLSLVAVIMANGIQQHSEDRRKYLFTAFALFLTSAFIINVHLWYESYKSGLTGKEMAVEAIKSTGKPVKKVLVVIIEDDYPKLSSFCVIPCDAFGWGLAARQETNYQWPEIIEDTTIERTTDAMIRARQLSAELLGKQKYDCVWIVNHTAIDVVKK